MMLDTLSSIVWNIFNVIAGAINTAIDFFDIDPFPALIDNINVSSNAAVSRAFGFINAFIPIGDMVIAFVAWLAIMGTAWVIMTVWGWLHVGGE